MSVNKMIVLGNVSTDVQIKTFENGGKVANFNVACNESWKDKTSGERKTRAVFIPVQVTGALVDVMEKYVHKGDKVYLEGKFNTREYEKDGVKHYISEMIVGPGGSFEFASSSANSNSQPPSPSTTNAPAQVPSRNDDDLPF